MITVELHMAPITWACSSIDRSEPSLDRNASKSTYIPFTTTSRCGHRDDMSLVFNGLILIYSIDIYPNIKKNNVLLNHHLC